MSDSSSPLKGWLAMIAFAVIVGSAVQPIYLRYLFADDTRIRDDMLQPPDRGTEEYVRFLTEVSRRTGARDRIAILAPSTRWSDGYDYFYYRASYLLAGRKIIPLLDESNQILISNLGSVDYVADWHVGGRIRGFRPVWSGAGGRLLQRIR